MTSPYTRQSWILDSRYWIPLFVSGTLIQDSNMLVGFRNPSAVFQIPIPTIPDSRRKKFPDSEFHKHKFPWFLYWGWGDRSPGDRSTGLLEIPVFKTLLLYRPPPIWQNFLLHGRVEWDKGGRERRLVLPINFLIVLCRLSVRIQLTKW